MSKKTKKLEQRWKNRALKHQRNMFDMERLANQTDDFFRTLKDIDVFDTVKYLFRNK